MGTVPVLPVFPNKELDCVVVVFPKRPPPLFVFPNPELPPNPDDPNPDLLLPNMMATRNYTADIKSIIQSERVLIDNFYYL